MIRGLLAGDKALGGSPALALALGIEKSGYGEHHRADEVHKEILHRVDKADIQIAAKAKAFAIDGHVLYPSDGYHLVGIGGIQGYRVKVVDNGVLLHVRVEEEIRAELEELPQHADGRRGPAA